MVALMIWLLAVAAIGSLIVVGVLRPARQSGHRASTVFTRRQAERERKRLEAPVRSADERLSASGRSKGRHRGGAPAAPSAPLAPQRPAARRPTPPVTPEAAPEPVAAPLETPAVAETPAAADVAATPTSTHETPDVARVAASHSPVPGEEQTPITDDSVIDARTRWERPSGDDAAAPEADSGESQPAGDILPAPAQPLRRAE